MQIQAKTITADTQVHVGDCYFVGAEYQKTGCAADRTMIIYNENSADVTSTKIMCTLNISAENDHDRMMLPMPGVKCEGIYVDWTTDGVGTIYYYL